jgi:hypothetical protein
MVTLAFALWGLRPALSVPGLLPPVSPVLVVALSLPALDSVSDAVFRLDCRAADAGCSVSQRAGSWHGKVHVAVVVVASVATVVAPFALAARMRLVDGWRDLAEPARAFGMLVALGLLANGVARGTGLEGWAQRTLITLACAGVVLLAARVLHLTPSTAGVRSPETDGDLSWPGPVSHLEHTPRR